MFTIVMSYYKNRPYYHGKDGHITVVNWQTWFVIKTTSYFSFSLQFSTVTHFKHANLKAPVVLDDYITSGVRLAWMMVTRIPPMIAIQPTKYDSHCIILDGCDENDVKSQPTISIQPILYYSYEGQVAVHGKITTKSKYIKLLAFV